MRLPYMNSKPWSVYCFVIALLLGAAFNCVACSSKTNGSQNSFRRNLRPTIAAPPALPAPSALSAPRRTSSAQRLRSGAEYDPALPYANVSAFGLQLAFKPYYNPGLDPEYNGLAYACYSFTIPAYAGAPQIAYEWDMSQPHYEKLWLGLANWSNDRWDWFACTAQHLLQLGSFTDYVNAEGRLMVLALAYDPTADQPSVSVGALNYIRLGAANDEFVKEIIDDTVQVGELDLSTSVWNHTNILYSDLTSGSEKLCFSPVHYGAISTVDNGVTNTLTADHTFGSPCVFYWHEGEATPKWSNAHSSADLPFQWLFSPETVLTPDAGGTCLYVIYNQVLYCVSYFNKSDGAVNLGLYDSLPWEIMPIPGAGPAASRTGIALDEKAVPCLSYYDSAGQSLCFVHLVSATWVVETVDDGGGADVGQSLKLCTNSTGDPFIAYYDATNLAIKLAYRESDAWHISTVDDAGPMAPVSGLALDATGQAHISYANLEDGSIRHAVYDGETWYIEIVDAEPGYQFGLANDIAFTYDGDMVIAYSGLANGNGQALLCSSRLN